MAEVYVDPFEFGEEAYEPHRETVDFLESFMEEPFGSDSDESEAEFSGLTREEIYLAPGSHIRAFHQRPDDEEDDEKNKGRQGKKRKQDPSR